jgi:hypothetical protein
MRGNHEHGIRDGADFFSEDYSEKYHAGSSQRCGILPKINL